APSRGSGRRGARARTRAARPPRAAGGPSPCPPRAPPPARGRRRGSRCRTGEPGGAVGGRWRPCPPGPAARARRPLRERRSPRSPRTHESIPALVSARAWVVFAAVSVLWGIPYLFIKIAVDDLEPGFVAWGGIAIGALVLLPIAWKLGALKGI